MKRGKLIFYFVLLVAVISLASAGIGDWFGTGRASDAPQDVSVTVTGANSPEVIYVEDINGGAGVDPVEYGVTSINLEIRVYDADGVGNIDDSSIIALFTRGAVTRTGPCIWSTDIDAYTANYSCSVNMYYYHEAGTWNVNASARDQENNYAENTSEIFTYLELKAFDTPLSPAELNWPPLVQGASNQNASNDPTLVNNTGNYAGSIYIAAYDLVGEDNPAENISATDFTVAGSSGPECSGSALGPDGVNNDTGIAANPGPEGSNLAYIYYCIPSVPTVSSQTYSTTARGESWFVRYI
jgi:hypothetical protein